MTEDLAGYDAADKMIERGEMTFDQLLEPTADLAARLHRAGLHHRDLYLCHFFVNRAGADVRLIDVARVKRLPVLLARRWIVKDLAQFWYSTLTLRAVSDAQRAAWLEHYAQKREINPQDVRGAIARKVRWIARHDVHLRREQPQRNISIPRSSELPG
jgi:hypothetical protein